jgi:putative secretion ATPase (PEP-CTERM system associated)
MYENHFSFKYKPFELVPNPDFLFLSNSHRKAMTYLDYGIKEKIGFMLLTGEIGCGKTTIIRNMIKGLNGGIKLSRVNNTKVSSEQLISMINEDFGIDIKGRGKTELLSDLNEFLIAQYAKGFQSVLLIDEAQNLNPDLLEEVRLLSNLETDRAKLLQIILVGQPELKANLMLPGLKQLRQRITINYHITPLALEETGKYIKHRLKIAGNPNAINPDESMMEDIYQFSRGVPRLINILCDFALLAAYVENEKEVSNSAVKEVIEDLKSYNYWNEDEEMNLTTGKEIVSESPGAVEEIAQRLSKLEEATLRMISDTAREIKSLSEKVGQLKECSPNKLDSGNDGKTEAGPSEHLCQSREIPDVRDIKNQPDLIETFNTEEKRPLVDQVKHLNSMLSYINERLRNL